MSHFRDEELTIPYILTQESKPHNFMEVKQYLNENHPEKLMNKEIAILGDRLMTDVNLGYKLKLLTIYTKGITEAQIKKQGLAVVILKKFEEYLLSKW